MTGARIDFTLNDGAYKQALTRFGGVLHSGVPRAIGAALVEETQKRFEAGRDVWGVAWAPLLPAYAAAKQGPGILRESRMLQRSITYQATGNAVAVGSNRVYAAVHQFGATITAKNAPALAFRLGRRMVRAKSVRIPARPYLGFGPKDQAAVMEVLDTVARTAFG